MVDLPAPLCPTTRVVGDFSKSISVKLLPVDKKFLYRIFSNLIITQCYHTTIGLVKCSVFFFTTPIARLSFGNRHLAVVFAIVSPQFGVLVTKDSIPSFRVSLTRRTCR